MAKTGLTKIDFFSQRVKEIEYSESEGKRRPEFLSIFDDINEIVYVADPESHKILYANEVTKLIFGRDFLGKKCHEAFQGMSQPCDFCTNPITVSKKIGESYTWEFQNRLNQRWYRCIDKAIKWPNGKMVRFEMAIDIHDHKMALETLRASDERYRTILEDIADGYHEVDLKGRFTFFNESFRKILGYTQEELLGMNYKVYAADQQNAEKTLKAYDQVYRTGEPLKRFEWEVIRKDGARRNIVVSISLIKDASDRPIGFRGIVRDETEQKQAEEALRESEERFRTLFNQAADTIYLMDASQEIPIIVDANLAAHTMHGYAPGELIGKPISLLNTPESAKHIGERMAILFSGKHLSDEGEHVRKDGSSFPVEISAQLLHLKGEPYIQAIDRDITERKQAETALKESEEKYRTILETIEDGYYEVNRGGYLTFSNDALTRIYERPREELMGKHSRDYMDSENYKCIRTWYYSGLPDPEASQGYPIRDHFQKRGKEEFRDFSLLDERFVR